MIIIRTKMGRRRTRSDALYFTHSLWRGKYNWSPYCFRLLLSCVFVCKRQTPFVPHPPTKYPPSWSNRRNRLYHYYNHHYYNSFTTQVEIRSFE